MTAGATSPLVADHVVVGAGAAGCVVVDGLSADGGSSVLLLEAGPASHDPLLQVPKGFIRTMLRESITWRYAIRSDVGAGVGDEVWLRGRTLGGSTAVNGSLHAAGDPRHYDELGERLGSRWARPAWERALGVVEQRLRPVPAPVDDVVAPAVLAALAATGTPTVAHLGVGHGERAGRTLSLIHAGRRQTAATAFLRPAARRRNLQIRTRARAVRLLLRDDRVTGVLIEDHGRTRVVHARRGVVLCGGTLETPLLLERSGIGDADVLRRVGIEPRVESPRVGVGLVEHRSITVKARLHDGIGADPVLSGRGAIARQVLRYLLTRGGPLATGPYEIGALLATTDGPPDVQLLATALATDDTGLTVARYPGLMIQGYLLRPLSQGQVHVGGPGPDDPPELTPRLLSTDDDRRAAGDVLDRIRSLLATEPLAGLVREETVPGPTVRGAEAAAEHALGSGAGIYHAVGTCAAGRGAEAVVDERLRVRGVHGLHVADASVFPWPPSGATASPTMALGVLATDLITEETR